MDGATNSYVGSVLKKRLPRSCHGEQRDKLSMLSVCLSVPIEFRRAVNEVGAVSQNCAAVKKEERNENGAPSLEAASVPTMSIRRRVESTRH